MCIYGELQLSASVLGKLGEQGVGILVLNGYKKEPVMLMPNQHVDAIRRQTQYTLSSQDFALQKAQQWVIQKLEGQRAVIQSLGESSSKLSRLDVDKFVSIVQEQILQASSTESEDSL